jgi:hypothetical protein
MEPIASILSYGVEALVGLVGLRSQGRSYEPHPIVGGGHTPVPSGHIWMVGHHTGHHRLAVLSYLHRVAHGWHLPGPRGWLSLQS